MFHASESNARLVRLPAVNISSFRASAFTEVWWSFLRKMLQVMLQDTPELGPRANEVMHVTRLKYAEKYLESRSLFFGHCCI